MKSCILQAALQGFAESWLEEVNLFFPEFASPHITKDLPSISPWRVPKRCLRLHCLDRGEKNQFQIPWARFCRMIKKRNDSHSALRGESVAVSLKWKSMPFSGLMKCEIKCVEVTRHFHLVGPCIVNILQKQKCQEKDGTLEQGKTEAHCTTEWQQDPHSCEDGKSGYHVHLTAPRVSTQQPVNKPHPWSAFSGTEPSFA